MSSIVAETAADATSLRLAELIPRQCAAAVLQRPADATSPHSVECVLRRHAAAVLQRLSPRKTTVSRVGETDQDGSDHRLWTATLTLVRTANLIGIVATSAKAHAERETSATSSTKPVRPNNCGRFDIDRDKVRNPVACAKNLRLANNRSSGNDEDLLEGPATYANDLMKRANNSSSVDEGSPVNNTVLIATMAWSEPQRDLPIICV